MRSVFGWSARAATYSASALTSAGLSLSRTTAPSPQQYYSSSFVPKGLLSTLRAFSSFSGHSQWS